MNEIAILGMGCLFPGYSDKDEFWKRLLKNDIFTTNENFNGRCIERGGLPKDPIKMDRLLKKSFGEKMPINLDTLGEVYKWTCYVCNEALKESGYREKYDILNRTGIIMGTLGMPTRENSDILRPLISNNLEMIISDLIEDKDFIFNSPMENEGLDPKGVFSDTEPTSVAAGLLSLGGPMLTFNAACATPLYGIKLASIYLNEHKADMMIAGSTCSNEHVKGNCGLFDVLGVLCDKGNSKPLDMNTKGLIAASGAGAFILKRLEDAVRDHDNILGVIENIGWSNDAGSKSILAPAVEGQIRALKDAYREDVSCDIDYIECHATGTKAGDQAELDAISEFFKPVGAKPLIGALKGNLGHFFTASANASIAKVLLSMKHGVIPATVSVSNPVQSSDGYYTGENIVLTNTSWPQTDVKKRAGINAFGFGGINAHMILSEYIENKLTKEKINKSEKYFDKAKTPVAIVGMGVHIGNWDSINKFFDALAEGKNGRQEPDSQRWRGIEKNTERLKKIGLEKMPKGCYVNSFSFDYVKNKLPPKENPYLMRRDLLLMNVTEQALNDADIKRGEYKNTAVIINCSQDFSDLRFMLSEEGKDDIFQSLRQSCPNLNEQQMQTVFNIIRENEISRETTDAVTGIIPNIRANRISSNWRFEGPSFILMEKENSIARSLEIARMLLSEKIVDCVVIGTVEFAGEFEHIFVQKEVGNINKLLDNGIGEGAAVLVLKREEQAEKDGNRIYALIEGISISECASYFTHDNDNTEVPNENLKRCISDSLNQADVSKKEVGFIDLPFVFYQKEKEETEKIYLEQYQSLIDCNDFNAGSVEKITGCCFSLTPTASLIKNALQLYYKIKFPSDNQTKVSSWIRSSKRRVAITGSFTLNGSCSQIVLSDFRKPLMAEQKKGGSSSLILIPVGAENPQKLAEKLDLIEQKFADKKSFKRTVMNLWNDYEKIIKEGQVLTYTIICTSKESFLTEIRSGKEHIKKVPTSENDWVSQGGSFFSPRPRGRSGKVVWMSPPGGMVEKNRIIDIIRLYPDLRNIVEMFDTVGDNNLFEEMSHLFFTGYFSDLITTILTKEMLISKAGIYPDMAIGASMGEISLCLALECIKIEKAEGNLNEQIGKMVNVFKILEDRNVCNQYFGENVKEWSSWYIKQSKKDIEAALADEPKVFITIIGSPNDIIISGEKEACNRVLKKLTGYRMVLEGSMFVHSPVIESSRDAIYKQLDGIEIRVKDDNPFCLYNTYSCKPVNDENVNCSENLVNIITKQVDFESVLNKVYEDGGKVFIDLGTNGLCAMWANNTLNDKDALVLSFHSAKFTFEENWYRFLATLISHGVPIALEKLHPFSDLDMDEGKPEFIKIISTGLPHHSADISTPENRNKIKVLATKNLERVSKFGDTVMVPQQHECKDNILTVKLSEQPYLIDSFYYRSAERNVEAYLIYQQNEAKLLKCIKQQAKSMWNKLCCCTSEFGQSVQEAKTVKSKRSCIWDYDDVLEMTNGSMSKVLGTEYEMADTYPIRARMPSPPFMFVTRITGIDAEFGMFRPSKIEMEYDISEDCIYRIGDKVSPLILTESGHIGIFLVGYIGIDIISKGKLHYRIADTKTTFHDELPCIGETIRGLLEVKSFPKNGNTMLMAYTYKCYNGDKLLMSMDAIGGFFTDQDLENSKGIPKRQNISIATAGLKRQVLPYITCSKQTFDDGDLEYFYNGKFTECFMSSQYENSNSKDYYTSPLVRMIDRIKEIRFSGGTYGFGEIIGEKELYPDHWAFNVHFKNDPIFPGTLMLDGINQVLFFYMIYSGVHVRYGGMNIVASKGITSKGSFRGQVKRIPSKLRFHISIKDIEEQSDYFRIVADADVFWQDKNVLRAENVCVTVQKNDNL